MVSPQSRLNGAENVALLHFLHTVPAPPTRNLADERLIRHDGYSLSFDHERKLVGVLAFLSSVTDEPDHIPAVCVEEKCDSSGLRVMLAVNKKSYQDGNKKLALIKEGFQSLFAILGQVSDGEIQNRCGRLKREVKRENENSSLNQVSVQSTGNVEEAGFAAIISMCSARILCRLRLVPNARKTQRQSFKTALENAIVCLQQLQGKKSGDDAHSTVLKSFKSSAKHVIKLIDSWTSYRSDGRLKELVQGVHHLSRVGGLQSLLDKLSHREMDPSSKKSLVNIVRKVARYREAARFLYRSAKKRPIIRHMEVVLVQLPESAFQRAQRTKYSPSLASALARLEFPQNRVQLGSICHLLHTSEAQAARTFNEQTLKTLEKGKIHAEVQLLAHYESMTSISDRRPRVICSSKDACCLCNALIGMFKNVYTPRCHGRLYPGWLLPAIPSLYRMQEQFNDCLKRQISDSLTTLLRTQKKTIHPDPNESTLLTLSLMATTTTTLSTEQNSSDTDSPPQRLKNGSMEPSSALSVHEPCQMSMEDRVDGLLQDDVNVANTRLHVATFFPVNVENNVDFMTQGEKRSTTIKCGAAIRIFRAGSLEVHVEHAPAAGKLSSDVGMTCSLEWLTEDEAQTLREKKPPAITEIESLATGNELHVQSPGCFYISARGSVLRLRFPQEPVVDER
ncbi:hypothetical protein E4U21_003389 [Claviceps maximensis]|nr:hypothetical protein E4U21_003389 [Claviceps maximensis]